MCPALSERYNRGSVGPRRGAGQFRSGTIEVVPRSVCRDSKQNAMAMEAVGA